MIAAISEIKEICYDKRKKTGNHCGVRAARGRYGFSGGTGCAAYGTHQPSERTFEESTTKIVVLSKQDSSTLTNQDIQTSTSLTKDYAELIKSRTVTEGVIAQLKLDMTHEKLLKKLSVDTPTDTRVVSITVTDTDPYTAAEIANAVRDIASKHIQQVMDIKAVNVVETANIPDEPSSPSVPKNGVIGGLLGILLAAAVVLIVYLTNDTVKTPEDVEKYLGLSVLGTIPYSSKMGKKSKKKKKRHA